jgi:hypothetical protein
VTLAPMGRQELRPQPQKMVTPACRLRMEWLGGLATPASRDPRGFLGRLAIRVKKESLAL